MICYMDCFAGMKNKLSFWYGDSVSFSYAVPDITNGLRVDKVFLYSHATQIMRPRPFAMVATAQDDGSIVYLADCRFEDFVDPAKHPREMALDYSLPETETIEDFQMEQRILRKLYEAVRSLAFRENLSDSDRDLLKKYRFLFWHSVPRSLIPYYKALSPSFDTWIKTIK